jgi:hypothetical protein
MSDPSPRDCFLVDYNRHCARGNEACPAASTGRGAGWCRRSNHHITCGVGAFGFVTGDRALGAYMVVAAVLVALALSGVVFIYRQAEREEPPA